MTNANSEEALATLLKIRTIQKEAVKAYVKYREQVENFYTLLKMDFETPESGNTLSMDCMENGEIIIRSNLCPLVMVFNSPDCLARATLNCLVREKHPEDDGAVDMNLSYPNCFIGNEDRHQFVKAFFYKTRMLDVMRLIDAKNAEMRSRLNIEGHIPM